MTKLEYALEKGVISKDESIFDIMKNTCVVEKLEEYNECPYQNPKEKHCLSCWTNIFYYKNRVNKGDKK